MSATKHITIIKKELTGEWFYNTNLDIFFIGMLYIPPKDYT